VNSRIEGQGPRSRARLSRFVRRRMRAQLDAAIEALLAEALPWRGYLIRLVAEVMRKWELKRPPEAIGLVGTFTHRTRKTCRLCP